MLYRAHYDKSPLQLEVGDVVLPFSDVNALGVIIKARRLTERESKKRLGARFLFTFATGREVSEKGLPHRVSFLRPAEGTDVRILRIAKKLPAS